jgi:hypothetical protein
MPKVKVPKPTPDFRKMYQLAERYSEASRLLDEQAKGEEWGCSAPQLLVDSFAVELYLKCLFVLDTNIAPLEEHDWVKLFDALAAHTKTAIREAFARIVRSDPVLSHLNVINPEALKVTDFDRSLAAAKNTFAKRRYLFEPLPTDEWFYAHLLREAIRAVTSMDIRLAGLNSLARHRKRSELQKPYKTEPNISPRCLSYSSRWGVGDA